MSDVDIENETYYDSDDSLESNYNFYEPEEPSLTKYTIVLCELYNPQYHGATEGEINYHYLTHVRFKKYIHNEMVYMRTILFRSSNIEIAECYYLPSQECVSILKTFWLKIIQRKWKNIIKERKKIIQKRCNPNSLMYREIHGKWHINCYYYPGIRGMLYNLSRVSF